MPDDIKVLMEPRNGGKQLPMDEEALPLNGKNNDEQPESSAVNFEEAISMTGQGKFHNILQLGCGLCLISMISEILSTSYLLPAAECDFNMSSSDKGMLSAVCYAGMITSSHLWGFMADTRGRKRTLMWTLLLDGICALASSFSHSYSLFLFLRFFNGFFICGPSSVVYAYMGEFHSAATRSRAIMWGAVFISGAIMALPGIAWVIISQPWSLELPLYTYHSWRVYVVICGLPSFITAALFLFYLPESPKFLLAQNKEEEALQVLRFMYKQNTGREPQHYKVTSLIKEDKAVVASDVKKNPNSALAVLRLMWNQTQPLFVSPHLVNTLLGCCLMFGIYASFNGLLLWLPEMFNRLAEYGDRHPGASATVCEAIYSLLNNTASTVNDSVIVISEKISNSLLVTDPLTSGALVEEILPSNITTQAPNATAITCSAVVAPAVFKKSLIIGGSSALANIICVLIIRRVGKKNILVFCLLVSGVCGFALLLARSATGVLVLSSVLEALTMTCPTVLNNILIDIFPTHLRAMAVCMSMLMGRIGTVVSSIILGLLLEVNCTFVFIGLGGILIVCGCLGYLLPAPWQWKVR